MNNSAHKMNDNQKILFIFIGLNLFRKFANDEKQITGLDLLNKTPFRVPNSKYNISFDI